MRQTTSTLSPSGSGDPGLLLKDTETAELVRVVEADGAVLVGEVPSVGESSLLCGSRS